MTPAHALFIPAVFLLGVLLGGVLAARRSADPRATVVAVGAPPTFWVSGRLLAGAFLVFAAVFVATHHLPLLGGPKALHQALGGVPIFDVRPVFSSAEVLQRLAAFGAEGRALYQRFTYTADLLFPLTLLAFLLLLALFVVQRSAVSSRVRGVALALPVLWFSADMAENTMIFHLIDQFPAPQPWLAARLGSVTVLKFCLLIASLLVPVLVQVMPRLRRVRPQPAAHRA